MQPALFISHGAPTLVVEDTTPAHQFLRGLGKDFPRPTAIVVASAHWLTEKPAVSGALKPSTIHDFYGFPQALYQMQYPASGAPKLAEKIAALIFGAAIDSSRGLDHGAWVPLKLMYPEADIPVLQLSIQPEAGARHHFALGQKLAALCEEGVLILGSGSLTHNLSALSRITPEAENAAHQFADWVEAALLRGDVESLLDYRTQAPFAAFNHPTEEHLLPLFVALGAGQKAQTLHRSFAFKILAMDAYQLEPEESAQ